jgi:hypothetical protein
VGSEAILADEVKESHRRMSEHNFRIADKSGAIGKNSFGEGTQHRSTPQANNRTAQMDYRDQTDYDHC